MKQVSKHILIAIFSLFFLQNIYSQDLINHSGNKNFRKNSIHSLYNTFPEDTVKNPKKSSNIKLSGIFLNLGFGLDVPLRDLSTSSNPTFGILGRIEYGSTIIFPFVPGIEIDYFSYAGSDNFITPLLLNSFRTKILSFGLSIEYTLAKLLNSSYTIPFIAFDIKTNKITRVIDPPTVNTGFPVNDSKISAGLGFGFTLFIFDFYTKYNFMKELSNLGFYVKIKFPVAQF
ncbi:MAG: hypothetical protein ABSF32_06205 [Ignavibacteria bacterium]|jgi:hypothetical protein